MRSTRSSTALRSTPLDDLLEVDAVDDPLDIDPLDHPVDIDGTDHGRDYFVGDGLDDAAGIVHERAEKPPPSRGAYGTSTRGHTSFLQSGVARLLARRGGELQYATAR